MEINFEMLPGMDLGLMHIFAMELVQKPRMQVRFDAQGREDHILYYHASGERAYYQEGQEIMRLEPGDMVFLPMNCRYVTIVEGDQIAHGYNVRFLLKGDQGDNVRISGGPRRMGKDENGRFLSLFQHLAALSMQTETRLDSAACLARLLSEIADILRSPHQDQWLPRALSYMGSHLQETISLQVLARHCHMSERTFCRKFKAETGKSPMACHREMRIEKAREFLEGGGTLEGAAETLGFTDASHLSRSFLKATGISPGRIRLEYKIKETPAEQAFPEKNDATGYPGGSCPGCP